MSTTRKSETLTVTIAENDNPKSELQVVRVTFFGQELTFAARGKTITESLVDIVRDWSHRVEP